MPSQTHFSHNASDVPHRAHAEYNSQQLLRSNIASAPASFSLRVHFSSLSLCRLPIPHSARYARLTSTSSVLSEANIAAFNTFYHYDPVRHALVYKPVAKKVCSVPAATPPEYRVVRELPPDPLIGITPLPTHPPDFVPGIRFTQVRADKLDIDPAKWLWPEEAKLV
jgi:hypothetical protein